MLWNPGERDGRNIGSASSCFSSTCEFDSFSEIYTVYIPEVGRGKQWAGDMYVLSSDLPLGLCREKSFTLPAELPPKEACDDGQEVWLLTACGILLSNSIVYCPFTREPEDRDSSWATSRKVWGSACPSGVQTDLLWSVCSVGFLWNEMERCSKVFVIWLWRGLHPGLSDPWTCFF